MNAGQIRALADGGTPGPWKPDNSVWAWIIGADEAVVARLPLDADAAKIVAAVNALPKVADLIEAIDATEHRRDYVGVPSSCRVCWDIWPCATIRARDALTTALGVSS